MQSNGMPHDAAQVPYDTFVTDEGFWIGLLQHRGPEDVVAFTTCEQLIGVFKSERDAVAALWRHAHGQAARP